MDRRGFLRGIFGGVAAGGLIIAAKPAEIEAFAAPLVKDAPLILDTPVLPTHPWVQCGQHLYNEHGEVVAIVTELSVSPREIDVTRLGDDNTILRSFGGRDIDIRAVGIGTVHMDGDRWPQLRGQPRRRSLRRST